MSVQRFVNRRSLTVGCPACRAHPRWVLQRHIGRYLTLEPGTRMAGLHRGEAFYPRSALCELHTVRALSAMA